MTWCIGGNPNDDRWLPDCRHCMSQAEQMAKDYEPPKPEKDHWAYCWGDNGGRFDRNCPECVKAAEALALQFGADYIYDAFPRWPRTGDTIMTGAQLTELEKRAYDRGRAAEQKRQLLLMEPQLEEAERKGYVRGHARALESVEIGDNARGLAYDAGVINGREQGKKLQFFKDRVLLKRHGFSDEGVDGVLGKGIT